MKIVPEPRAGIWGRRGCHAIEDSRRGEPATTSPGARRGQSLYSSTALERHQRVRLTPGYPAILSRKVHGSTRLVSEARAEAAKSASPSIVRQSLSTSWLVKR